MYIYVPYNQGHWQTHQLKDTYRNQSFDVCQGDFICAQLYYYTKIGGRRGRDRMVAGFTTTCAISANHHRRCEFEPRS